MTNNKTTYIFAAAILALGMATTNAFGQTIAASTPAKGLVEYAVGIGSPTDSVQMELNAAIPRYQRMSKEKAALDAAAKTVTAATVELDVQLKNSPREQDATMVAHELVRWTQAARDAERVKAGEDFREVALLGTDIEAAYLGEKLSPNAYGVGKDFVRKMILVLNYEPLPAEKATRAKAILFLGDAESPKRPGAFAALNPFRRK